MEKLSFGVFSSGSCERLFEYFKQDDVLWRLVIRFSILQLFIARKFIEHVTKFIQRGGQQSYYCFKWWLIRCTWVWTAKSQIRERNFTSKSRLPTISLITWYWLGLTFLNHKIYAILSMHNEVQPEKKGK